MTNIELLKQHDQLLADLIQVDETDVKTKTDLIRRLIEVSRPLLKTGQVSGLKDSDLASYINAKLIENGIKVFVIYTKFSDKRECGHCVKKLFANSIFGHAREPVLDPKFDCFTNRKLMYLVIQIIGPSDHPALRV